MAFVGFSPRDITLRDVKSPESPNVEDISGCGREARDRSNIVAAMQACTALFMRMLSHTGAGEKRKLAVTTPLENNVIM
jgi:hypothetical protein